MSMAVTNSLARPCSTQRPLPAVPRCAPRRWQQNGHGQIPFPCRGPAQVTQISTETREAIQAAHQVRKPVMAVSSSQWRAHCVILDPLDQVVLWQSHSPPAVWWTQDGQTAHKLQVVAGAARRPDCAGIRADRPPSGERGRARITITPRAIPSSPRGASIAEITTTWRSRIRSAWRTRWFRERPTTPSPWRTPATPSSPPTQFPRGRLGHSRSMSTPTPPQRRFSTRLRYLSTWPQSKSIAALP